MNHFLHGVTRAVAESFALPDPILEVGAYQVAGHEHLANLRPLFPGRDYTGLDMRAGPGVDIVANAERLPQDTASVGTLLSLNTLEHTSRFWRVLDEFHRVLRPDGALFITCPFYFHIHEHPSDYWRFTPEALEVMLEDYPQKIIGWQGNSKKPLHVWALAFREDRPPITREEFETYRMRIGRYAYEPLPWKKRVRYWIGRFLCGRRPFIPYLEQNRWETICRPPLCLTTGNFTRTSKTTNPDTDSLLLRR